MMIRVNWTKKLPTSNQCCYPSR